MLLSEDNGTRLLLTDPWLLGSTYWRSWWLQNYPSAEEFEGLKEVKYVYITHEHPDHFHPPTLRQLGKVPLYLCPALPEDNISVFLKSHDFNAEPLTPLQWRKLTDEVSILSIPLWNDDSVLLVTMPGAFVVNLNDAKPSKANLKRLRRFLDEHVPAETPLILLSSYSPASVVNSFMKGAKRVSMKQKSTYVKYINKICDTLRATYFMPFASQVIFLRSDSQWANAFKVTIDDLQTGWLSKTKLLHPYSTIDTATLETSHIDPADYHGSPDGQMAKIEAQELLDVTADVTDEDIERLENKMRTQRYLFALLFPRGIGFSVKGMDLFYNTWKGRIIRDKQGGDFTLRVPTQAIKDVLAYDHFADLGITMFTIVSLNSGISPAKVYLFFILLMMDDYDHTTGPKNFIRWVKSMTMTGIWRIPEPVTS